MRVGLNLLHALPEIGGGWNYIANLLSALGQYDTNNEYVAYVNSKSDCLVPNQPNFHRVHTNVRGANRTYRVIYENTMLQIMAKDHKLDCMHWYSNTIAIHPVVPGIVTFYDLLVFNKLSPFPLIKRAYLRSMMRHAVRRAAVLLPISAATGDELVNILNADPEKVAVIPVIIGPEFMLRSEEEKEVFRLRYSLPKNYWVYVAHLYPHKNHIRLLIAYAQLKKMRQGLWPLVLRGDGRGSEVVIQQAISDYRLKSDVILLPPLERNEIPLLYSAASAMIYPSIFEGSGIPTAEAMACGCPIISSDIPAVRESVRDAALYFNPTNVDSIICAIQEFLDNETLSDAMRRRGLREAEKHRAFAVINKLLKCYYRASQVLP
jgi:glycosyltransferase involved in cell wall biosynthesis